MINDLNDAVILAARLFLVTLFLIFGWRKLRDYSGMLMVIVSAGAGPYSLDALILNLMNSRVA